MRQTTDWHPACLAIGCLLAAIGRPLDAQTPVGQAPRPPVEDAQAKQRSAAAAMEASLARQRASVQKQLGQSSTEPFFVLPRPAGLGPVTAPAWAPPPADCEPLPAPEIESLIGEAARREAVDADLLRGIMKQESGFRPCAISPKGAMGLMQLMPATAQQFGIGNPFDASSNVEAGAKLLKQLLVRYGGDVSKALAAYNAGPSRVDASGGIPAIPETLDYIRQILSALPFR
jgi:soluble lytic murein transglycosylase-like protein